VAEHSLVGGATPAEQAAQSAEGVRPRTAHRKSANKQGRFYRSTLTAEEREWLDEAIALTAGEQNGLEEELAAARVILKRLVGMEGNEAKAVAAALSIGRLQEIRRRLGGKQANGLVAAVDAVLAELGLGEVR